MTVLEKTATDTAATVEFRGLRREFGATVVQCSDEYYVTAGVPIPSRASYDGYPQYENGVGMVRTMFDDWAATRRRLKRRPVHGAGRKIVIACGTLARPILAGIADEARRLTGLDIELVGVTNTLFGERVNVSGLVPGADFRAALAGRPADTIVLPRASLDYFGRQFLDGVLPSELQASLGVPVAFASQWSEVIDIARHGPRPLSSNAAPNGAFWSYSEPAAATFHVR